MKLEIMHKNRRKATDMKIIILSITLFTTAWNFIKYAPDWFVDD
jgi:hypothetical protein